jgi:hypothetical protein
MTHREHFNRRKRSFSAMFLAVLVVGITAGFASVLADLDWLFLAALLCIPLLMVVLYIAVIFGFRCPSCHGQWGWIAMYSGPPTAIRQRLVYCPYCRVELDAAADTLPSTKAQ